MVRKTIYLPEPVRAGEDDPDRSWVRELAGAGRSEDGQPVADRVDDVLAETGFGTQ
jgi:hypothetical protein